VRGAARVSASCHYLSPSISKPGERKLLASSQSQAGCPPYLLTRIGG